MSLNQNTLLVHEGNVVELGVGVAGVSFPTYARPRPRLIEI